MNIWKITTFLLALLLIFVYISLYQDFGTDSGVTVNLGGVEIDKVSLDLLADKINSTSFFVCDLEANKCLAVKKSAKGGETE